MKLAPPDLASFQHIYRNLRERDRAELECAEWDFKPDDAAGTLLHAWRIAGMFGQVVHLDEPVALLVMLWTTPTACNVGLLATDRWPEVVAPFAKHCRRKLEPMVRAKGVKRIECRTWDQHNDARRWLCFFRAKEECRIPHWGKGGETFIQYGWTADVRTERQDVELRQEAGIDQRADASA